MQVVIRRRSVTEYEHEQNFPKVVEISEKNHQVVLVRKVEEALAPEDFSSGCSL